MEEKQEKYKKKNSYGLNHLIVMFILGLLIGSGITYLFCKRNNKIIPPSLNTSNQNYQGIDVSNHQGSIDWSKVALDKNIQFVYVKATEGATYQDKQYKNNIKGAKENGILVGSYHFLRNTSSIKSQFHNFDSMVVKDLQDLVPMVDVEEKVAKDSILMFCEMIKDVYGKAPMIYGTNRSYNSFCAPDFNNYYLMIGRYGSKPPIINGKGHYSIWQFSEDGIIDGIPKKVDLDRFHPDFNLSKIRLVP